MFKDLVQDAADIEQLDELEAPPPAAAKTLFRRAASRDRAPAHRPDLKECHDPQ